MKRALWKACIIGSRIIIITGTYQRPKTYWLCGVPASCRIHLVALLPLVHQLFLYELLGNKEWALSVELQM